MFRRKRRKLSANISRIVRRPISLLAKLDREVIMGGCASKPKDLDTDRAPAPVEAPAPAEKSEAETVEHVSEKYLTLFDQDNCKEIRMF